MLFVFRERMRASNGSVCSWCLGALILLNEFARRTKAGGIFMFIGV